jgi:hypothetical protein
MKKYIVLALLFSCRSDYRSELETSSESGNGDGDGDVSDGEGDGTSGDGDGDVTSSSGNSEGDSSGDGDGDGDGDGESTSSEGGSSEDDSSSGGMPDMMLEDDPAYPECNIAEDCPGWPDDACSAPGHFCSETCFDPQDVWKCTIPDTGTATPKCIDGPNYCLLDCSGGKTCPNGMICEDIVFNGNPYGLICTQN